MASHPIYQFKAELSDYKPLIWRRFQVSNDISLARLAYIVLTMFEMEANHLFAVEVYARRNMLRVLKEEVPGRREEDLLAYCPLNEIIRYEIAVMENDNPDYETFDPVGEKLRYAVSHTGDELSVEYDFGDGWRVLLKLEEVFEDKELPGKELPRVLAGEGFGIIEDCGGPDGLKQLARSFAKKKGADYEENREWLGVDNLNLEAFDLEDMNFRVKKIPRIYADLYEYGLPPTKASENLLARKYKQKR
jgi:hypothetical protein